MQMSCFPFGGQGQKDTGRVQKTFDREDQGGRHGDRFPFSNPFPVKEKDGAVLNSPHAINEFTDVDKRRWSTASGC